jgi:hypothetical protein
MLMSLNDSPPDKAAARAELERRTVMLQQSGGQITALK